MARCWLDHLVVTAPTLVSGCDWIEHSLGVRPQEGGVHDRMGTHNSLLPLGESVYLEVIAVNPATAPPPRPRWFGLDDLPQDAQPCLAAWVVRCDDIGAVLAASSIPLGEITPMTRGDLEWLITIPADGRLVLSGALPVVIQWISGQHPATRLNPSGCSLATINVRHPEARRISSFLGTIGLERPGVHVLESAEPSIGCAAAIQTPAGVRWLGAGR